MKLFIEIFEMYHCSKNWGYSDQTVRIANWEFPDQPALKANCEYPEQTALLLQIESFMVTLGDSQTRLL